MSDRFNLPVVSGSASPDAALKKLRSTGAHAMVVIDEEGALLIRTSKELVKAKARRLDTINQIRAKGLVVAKPEVPTSERKRILSDKANWLMLFGKSRARYVLGTKSRSRATIISRREEYASVSAGVACLCPNCDYCADSPPAQHGHSCPKCGKGRFDCY